MTDDPLMEFTARVVLEDGSYWAEVLELPGCFASGGTLDELREALEESISLYLHDDPAAGQALGPEEPRRAARVDQMKLALA